MNHMTIYKNAMNPERAIDRAEALACMQDARGAFEAHDYKRAINRLEDAIAHLRELER
jgi:hypothetical protein